MSGKKHWIAGGLVAGLAMFTSVASAVPIYSETFTGNTADSGSTAVTGVATISGEAGQVVTTSASQEGTINASSLSVGAATEYTIGWDVTVNSATEGANFYALLAFNGGIHDLWLLFADDGTGDWELLIKDDGGDTTTDNDYSFGQTVSILLHHTANVDDEIDVYLDGNLYGTFVDLLPSKDLSLMLFGDGSGGTSTGNVTYDNIVVNLGGIPEPASLALISVGGLMMLRRRN